jgi:hypothetical protein
MSDEELKYPQWQEPLQAALSDAGSPDLLKKIQAAEQAIYERFQILADGRGHDPSDRPWPMRCLSCGRYSETSYPFRTGTGSQFTDQAVLQRDECSVGRPKSRYRFLPIVLMPA